MDNVLIYNGWDLRNILVFRNIVFVKFFLYFYDFNVIELVFGIVKMYVERWFELFRVKMLFVIVNVFL